MDLKTLYLSQTDAGLELQLSELTAKGATLQLSLAKLPEPRHFNSSQKYTGIKQHDAVTNLLLTPSLGMEQAIACVL